VAGCRAGFEAEAAADLGRAAAALDRGIAVEARQGEGYVVGRFDDAPAPRALQRLGARPVFARNLFVATGPVDLLGRHKALRPDRVAPLLATIATLAAHDHGTVWRPPYVEYPDTNEGKALSPLARALAERLTTALGGQGRLRDDASRRLHVYLPDGARAFVGTSEAATTPWPLGIPRIRVPRGAPSRSAAKLAEAFVVFLGDEAGEVLRPGMRAVDLGAAPGGWTWLLVERGLRVTAVDNGPLKGPVANDPLVTHLRTDGLSYRPRRPVDWLVCDIVERPARIAELVAGWMADGDARFAIFNLKLPMKKRDDEVRRCTEIIGQRLAHAGVAHDFALRQLYHDREEVTGCVVRHEGAAPDAVSVTPRGAAGRGGRRRAGSRP
jgi:23S rRNA (cytidine2498-2'-O)-methyltransferase